MSIESRVKSKKIEAFTDLIAWQQAHTLVLAVYKLINEFPKKEEFALSSQLRRALISITSNLAEGFGRKTVPDRLHFYIIAQSSLTEVQNQLLLACDLGYLEKESFTKTSQLSVVVHKLIGGLIKATRRQKS